MKKIISLLLVTFMLMSSLAACGNDGGNTNGGNSANNDNVQTQEQTQASEAAETAETAAVIDPKTADYSKVDITIPFDSGEEIVKFTDDMLAGKYDGQIVKCEGITCRRMFGNAMMQKQADGSSRGFTWYLVDAASEDDYPPEDSRVELTGIVGIGDYDVRYLYVLPENVVIKDAIPGD